MRSLFKMKKKIMAYKTDRATTIQLLNRMHQKIIRTTRLDPHPGLIIASQHFSEPYPLLVEFDLVSLVTMDLLILYVYPSLSGYGKFTIILTIKRFLGGDEFSFSIGPAIALTSLDCQLIPMAEVYTRIYNEIMKAAENYEGYCIVRVTIRVYVESKNMDRPSPSSEERDSTLSSIIQGELTEIEPITPARKMRYRKRNYPTHITKVIPRSTERKPFLVADTETILIDDVHKPYAAGLLMVRPGEEINDLKIETYFSEDYSIILDSFEDRSTKVLYDLVLRISTIVRQEKSIMTIDFHNFSRFDGIILIKHLACHHKNYKLKPLMRNRMLYELAVYSGKKLLFRFRDSLHLLPGKLDDIAKNLCPGLGPKGSIPYDEVILSNIVSMKKSLLDYMKQDILLLGGVMQKAQERFWNLYKVDIESKITAASMAMTIFRMRYYDQDNWPIHIPSRNEDTFIRRGYYGGHTDVYIPYGENLYNYDANSLYPFAMLKFAMPGGKPVWHGNLGGKDLDSLFGFIEAYVVCPKTIKRPFLPYKDKNKILIFPTGEFVGVYYSEELKYARDLGYTVIPISGYLFERKESPFKDFVSSLFESRLEAKKYGNEAFSFVYKLLMNSLYGRFGINPKSTTTEISDQYRYNHLIKHSELLSADMLNDNTYIISYHRNFARPGP